MKKELISEIGILFSIFVVLISLSGTLAMSQTSAFPSTLTLSFYNSNIEAYSSFATYNPNIFAGGLGGNTYGLLYAYSAIVNVTNSQMIPGLVVSWNFSPSNWQQVWTTQPINVTLVIRNDTGWSNGQPVTAYDILADCLVLDMFGAPPFPNYTVINNYTIVETWPKDTLSPILYTCTLINTAGLGSVALIIPYSVWKPIVNQILGNWTKIQNTSNMKLAKQIINNIRTEIKNFRPNPTTYPYSGPFYLAQLSSSEIVLDKNPYYFDAKYIPFNQVILYQYGQSDLATAAITSGQVSLDWAGFTGLSPTQLESLPTTLELIKIPQPFGWALAYNLKDQWLRYYQVRAAIAYILNRSAIAAVGGPLTAPVSIPNAIPNESYYSFLMSPQYLSSLNPYNVNFTKAAQLLESVGLYQKNGQWYYPNGTPFTLVIGAGAPPPQALAMMEEIQKELEAFGISVQLNIYSVVSQWHQAWQNGTGYDLWFENWGSSYSPETAPWSLVLSYFGGYPWNVTQWDENLTLPNGTVIDFYKLLQETESPNTTQQLIQANQELSYYMNQYLLPVLPLVEVDNYVIVNPSLLLDAPPANSWIWQESEYGIGGTAMLQALIDYWYVPLYKSTIVTTTSVATTTATTTATVATTATATTTSVATSTVTTTVPTTSTVTVTKAVSNTLAIIAAIIVVIIVIIIAVVVLLTRRR
ncbi:ABC transporter substrate-binding protein [Sulfolobus sp. A20]|uniref:ABC transporter substrate-binding protein n=1 Tax=Saccharolobus sp. A20 TaxID=1891280 RepID=UPI000845BF66|nr:ABC transporter substrate-binding protein [Sulfolobus sp. A20]TRM75167.1 ABC transporter substrate-binding protein [Sulfolobus sp. A20-N-F8]TRM75336.1 ABC transporter substrate-binding protein [Sulfolobus sp. B5]TRM82574.1 ABC transporter substrate-binding protein [Sulfolobus sp. A20-N-F6]TRM87296.1 ABC transporter substrate-binding protein [Sulfolobus sp. C3]TRM93622.1 ABC transporter substrate-binding protein [Sulfolobus sp. A20-N-G8]TRM99912.1 ABC transporter substrate-binding protein [